MIFLEEYLCIKIVYFHIVYFFSFSNMILSDALILAVSQLQIE